MNKTHPCVLTWIFFLFKTDLLKNRNSLHSILIFTSQTGMEKGLI